MSDYIPDIQFTFADADTTLHLIIDRAGWGGTVTTVNGTVHEGDSITLDKDESGAYVLLIESEEEQTELTMPLLYVESIEYA